MTNTPGNSRGFLFAARQENPGCRMPQAYAVGHALTVGFAAVLFPAYRFFNRGISCQTRSAKNRRQYQSGRRG